MKSTMKVAAIVGMVVMGIAGVGHAGESLSNPELDRFIKAMEDNQNIGMAAETTAVKNCSAQNNSDIKTIEGYDAILNDPCLKTGDKKLSVSSAITE